MASSRNKAPAAAKPAPPTAEEPSPKKRRDAVSRKTAAKIERLAESVLKTVNKGKNPFLEIPVRSLANVNWSDKKRLVELGDQKQKRYFFNVAMARKFMQTFLVSEACKELIDSGKTTSIRDLYYVTKHTIGDTRQNTFEEQDESDPIIEDLEVTLDSLREELHLFAARKGSMVGPLTITDTGDTIDLRRMGSGGWAVPSIVEQNVIGFRKHEAKYVLLIEKDAVWTRFNEDKFWKRNNCIIVQGGGQPPRGVRRLVQRLHTELGLPVYVLVDNDPWGFYIYSVMKQGSINLAYESMRMAVPDARFVGLSSFDKEKYALPTNVAIRMDDTDNNRAKQMLAYPWFRQARWQREIQEMVRSGQKFELEALSRRGISFITEEYLPKKLQGAGLARVAALALAIAAPPLRARRRLAPPRRRARHTSRSSWRGRSRRRSRRRSPPPSRTRCRGSGSRGCRWRSATPASCASRRATASPTWRTRSPRRRTRPTVSHRSPSRSPRSRHSSWPSAAGSTSTRRPPATAPHTRTKAWIVTPRQLLCHQGGVRSYRAGEPAQLRRFTSIPEALVMFRDDPLVYEPGTSVLYTTYGYCLLGCVVEGAAGRPFADVLRDEVFAPSGMTATQVDDPRVLIPRRANGYVRNASGELLNSALADVTYKVPGGGLCGTAPDVARFGLALLSGRLLGRSMLQQMLTPQRLRTGRVTGFGLGLTVGTHGGRREAWHIGGQERVSTLIYLRPDSGVVVALLSNLEKVQVPLLALGRRIADLLTAERVLR